MRVLPVLTDLATRANVVAFQASSFADALLWLMRGRLLAAALFGAFGLAAWSVAFTGTFSLVAVLVAEQRRQIAIRSALGASRIRLLVTVTSAPLQGLVIGLGVGAAAVVVFGGSLQALLYGVHVFEPTLWLMVTVGLATSVILGALAACAAWRPLELAKLLNVN
jgi:ABC-type antimicrobial peptide transport system permease subunit